MELPALWNGAIAKNPWNWVVVGTMALIGIMAYDLFLISQGQSPAQGI